MTHRKIREADHAELESIVSLYNLMWIGSKNPIDMKMAESYFAGLQHRPNHFMYVIEEDGRLVGTFLLLIKEDADKEAPEGVLENVAVHPRFRHQGIGTEMVDFAIEKCKLAGCARLIQPTNEKREDAAAFFESKGFARVGYNLVYKLPNDK